MELLTNDYGDCAGCVVYWLVKRHHTMVRAKAVILATGGIGRMHLNSFPTSNHFGAMGDGLVLAYWRPGFLRLSGELGKKSMKEHIVKSLPVGTILGLLLATLVTTISYFWFMR